MDEGDKRMRQRKNSPPLFFLERQTEVRKADKTGKNKGKK